MRVARARLTKAGPVALIAQARVFHDAGGGASDDAETRCPAC